MTRRQYRYTRTGNVCDVRGGPELAIALSVVEHVISAHSQLPAASTRTVCDSGGALRALLAEWELPVVGPMLDLAELFGGDTPVVLDIGFGGGEGLVEMAAARPHEAIIGAEVHTPGVANVLDAVESQQWRHVRVVAGDVLEFLPRLPASPA
jgi:tRNA G46 methylase TrmB